MSDQTTAGRGDYTVKFYSEQQFRAVEAERDEYRDRLALALQEIHANLGCDPYCEQRLHPPALSGRKK